MHARKVDLVASFERASNSLQKRSVFADVESMDFLLEQIDKGISPGEEVANRWRDEWDRDWSDLIEATRF